VFYFLMNPKGYKSGYRQSFSYQPSFHQWLEFANLFVFMMWMVDILCMLFMVSGSFRAFLILTVAQIVTGVICAFFDPEYYYW